jgi:hypothetical protein
MQDASRIYERMRFAPLRTVAASLIWTPIFIGISAHSLAQNTAQVDVLERDETAVAGAAVVPQQVRYAGKLATRAGDTVEAVFRIYAAVEGGEPLWTETQRVTVGEDGSYSVLLGGASLSGLPQAVFSGGAARWLGVSVERSAELDRVLLSSVPYAMKSADAELLAGHAASEFVTQQQLAQLAQSAAESGRQSGAAPEVQPNTSGTVTGSGTLGTVPLWTGSLTQGNSEIVQVGSDIGINEATPAATLDVGGTAMFRGTATLPAENTATASAGYRSQLLDFTDSAWSTATKAPVAQTWRLYATDSGNDSTNPTSSFNFQFQNGAGAATPTVLSIAETGVISFAPAQTFPGTIESVTATSPVTATTTSGTVSVGLDQSALVTDIAPAMATAISPTLENTYNGVYAQLGAYNNVFTGSQTIEGASNIYGSITGEMFSVENTAPSFGEAISASYPGEFGYGITASAGIGGIGIESVGTQGGGAIGVIGSLPSNGSPSGSYTFLHSNQGLDAGLWGDTADGGTAGLIATADNEYAAFFRNDSATVPTLAIVNADAGPTEMARKAIGSVLRASGAGGMCGINQTGNLSCTGQVKAVVSSRDGARQVETYTVQSAENWVEDYGSGELNHGSATVMVEPAFSDTVNTGVEFHVFLTPGGDCKGLYVTNKTAGSFEVLELGGGTSSIPFDYKIVAKRNGMEDQRLVDVTDRMRSETEAVQFKPLAHPLPPTNFAPRNRATVVGHSAQGLKP